jgi:MFS family permease
MIDSIRTDIPARLDRLPWSAWHWKVVIALGVSWLLDGLEVTVVGSLGPALQRPDTLGLTAGQIGWAASAYIGGAVLGALYFGRLADKLGRKRMFMVTLAVYLVATVMTAFTWDMSPSRSAAFSPASASVANTPRSIRRSTSSSRRGYAGASISPSMERFGSGRRWVQH